MRQRLSHTYIKTHTQCIHLFVRGPYWICMHCLCVNDKSVLYSLSARLIIKTHWLSYDWSFYDWLVLHALDLSLFYWLVLIHIWFSPVHLFGRYHDYYCSDCLVRICRPVACMITNGPITVRNSELHICRETAHCGLQQRRKLKTKTQQNRFLVLQWFLFLFYKSM